MKVRYIVPVVGVILLFSSCTPNQIRAWEQWHKTSPRAAEAYANSSPVQRQLGNTRSRENNSHYIPPHNSSISSSSCYASLFRAYGLPVSTFQHIARRESGCNANSFVNNRTDLGGGLLGINLKGRLGPTWHNWCGATVSNITNANVNVRCAAIAYRKMGLRPWN